jgi:hypothetical protein
MAFPAIAMLDSGCDATCISYRKLQQMEKEMGKAAPTPWGYLPFYVTVSCGDERFRLGPPDGVCLLPAAFPLADQEDVLIGRDILNGRRVECDGLARLSSDVLGAVAIEVFETERLT